jgi:hypothetical protein
MGTTPPHQNQIMDIHETIPATLTAVKAWLYGLRARS